MAGDKVGVFWVIMYSRVMVSQKHGGIVIGN